MDLTCAICLEQIINISEKKTLLCEHMYHKACIEQVENNKCPLCKGEIKNIELLVYEGLCSDMNRELRRLTKENEKLLKLDRIGTNFLKSITDSIEKSIKNNRYTVDIKEHYNIDITNKYNTLTPLCCKYCELKTGKFGILYNHINKKHNEHIIDNTVDILQ